mmetsp:Transcript_2846/g.6161  ORF Transcript_2846/g.6161 Transcript_2846/m.6161 type:complete len:344 (-) Transcript_2846:369-1400(-)
MFCLPLLPSPLPYMSKALRSTSSASSSCFCRSSLRSWSGFLGLRTYRKPWGSTRFREKALDRFREAFERRMVTTRISSASLPGRVTRMASPTEISFSNFVSCPDTTVPDVVMRPVPFWIVGANDDDASFVRFLGAERTSVSALVPGCFDALGGGGGDDDENAPSCFDVTQEIPAGANAKIRGSDNSGSGGGTEGRIWEFQCCKDLIVRAGYSTNSMFLPRPFSYEWHEEHCRERFPGIAVEPYRMNDQWGFADLTKTSRIVFANGMNDGWSVASITNATEVSDALGFRELVVLDFPNGAHHSELKAGPYPNPSDTPDILEGYQKATEILSGWLDDIAANQEVL